MKWDFFYKHACRAAFATHASHELGVFTYCTPNRACNWCLQTMVTRMT